VEAGEVVVLDEGESHHAASVLRVAPGEEITLTDGAGAVAGCSVEGLVEGRLHARVLVRKDFSPDSPRLSVYMGAAKGSKVDGVVERLAELGVAEVGVYTSERSVVSWDAHKRERLERRWKTIARSAAKQSRSPFVMRTSSPLPWGEMVERVAREPIAFALWEEASAPLRSELKGTPERIAMVVGPEGGLSHEEVDRLSDVGALPVSLGTRILRTENAPIVATSAVLYHFGLIG
jgi:16S rRNA (uracil1498-N3)-methyltransferase